MMQLHPTADADLVVGCLDAIAMPRTIPVARIPVILRRPQGWVQYDDEVMPLEHFELLLRLGDATRVIPRLAQPGHVLFWDVGTAPALYIAAEDAARRMESFADACRDAGDTARHQGLLPQALLWYARGAAAAQREQDYERMLLCPMPERRRQRILKVLVHLRQRS